MRSTITALGSALALTFAAPLAAAPPTLPQFLSYRFVSQLVAVAHGDRIAWIEDIKGVRNVWAAAGPGYAPRQLTHYTEDDGQELTQLGFDPGGDHLVYVRGGDHDGNWPAEGNLAPDPAAATDQPLVTIWTVPFAGSAPLKLAEGDSPSVSPQGQVAYVKDDQLWATSLDGKAKPAKLLFDRGKDREPLWSPDGHRLAFVSGRGDHNFITVYTPGSADLTYVAPSTGRDDDPVWSPDGQRIAFTRQPGDGGAPDPLLVTTPHPFAIWTADAATGAAQLAWRSPATLDGSYPQDGDGVGLRWMAGGTLAFIANLDGWEHLYALPAGGGTPRLLTPGAFMVEHVAMTQDKAALLYAANTGDTAGDGDRRHAYRVAPGGGAPVALSGGMGSQWYPVAAGKDRVALVASDPQHPAAVALADGKALRALEPTDYPSDALVTPTPVHFAAPDGLPIEGQLFTPAGKGPHPALVFVHGGPPRQMLLGWHYMDYYAHAYAVNQYWASRGFVVLSVNYRLGVGYGRAFEQPAHAGPAGAAEYQDVLAGARWLQAAPGVDPRRIGIWGGSYGGYLTAMALSRNSDVFAAGVDWHGVHDWSRTLGEEVGAPLKRYEQGDWPQAMKTAFEASPVSTIDRWRSPVLLIQGDDDRNVRFNQTVDLAGRLTKAGVPFEELVIPNEIHFFLRYQDLLHADTAMARFLETQLKP